MLENAVRICDAKFGNIFDEDGELSPRRCAQCTGAFVEARSAVIRSSPLQEARLAWL